MKFVVTWKVRSGASAADNEAAAARTLEVFGKWVATLRRDIPSVWLSRRYGRFRRRRNRDPDSLAEAPAKFGTYLDFEIIPVNDITETTWPTGRGSRVPQVDLEGSLESGRVRLGDLGLRFGRGAAQRRRGRGSGPRNKRRSPKASSPAPWATTIASDNAQGFP